MVKGTACLPFLPPKLLLLCRILVATLISCTIRELWLCVIFPHVKFLTSPYQNIFPFHNLVCYDIVTPSFWFPISANLAGSMSYPYFPPLAFQLYFIKLSLSIVVRLLMFFSEREWVTQYCQGEFTFYLLQQVHFADYYRIWRDVIYSKDYPELL